MRTRASLTPEELVYVLDIEHQAQIFWDQLRLDRCPTQEMLDFMAISADWLEEHEIHEDARRYRAWVTEHQEVLARRKRFHHMVRSLPMRLLNVLRRQKIYSVSEAVERLDRGEWIFGVGPVFTKLLREAV